MPVIQTQVSGQSLSGHLIGPGSHCSGTPTFFMPFPIIIGLYMPGNNTLGGHTQAWGGITELQRPELALPNKPPQLGSMVWE